MDISKFHNLLLLTPMSFQTDFLSSVKNNKRYFSSTVIWISLFKHSWLSYKFIVVLEDLEHSATDVWYLGCFVQSQKFKCNCIEKTKQFFKTFPFRASEEKVMDYKQHEVE